MRKVWWICAYAAALGSFACGMPPTMHSMNIEPASVSFVGSQQGQVVHLSAYGNFAHPTETRDVTTEVTWSSAIPEIANVDSKGTVTTTGMACGTTVILARANRELVGEGSAKSVIIASVTVHVSDPNHPTLCP